MVRNRNEKIYAIGETECNEIEVFIVGGQRIDQKRIRDGGEGVERGLRWKHKR